METPTPRPYTLRQEVTLIGVITTNFSDVLRFFEPSQNFFSLAIDSSTSPPTAYVASDAGDIYVSTNRGASFTATSLFNQPAPMTLVLVTPSGELATNFLRMTPP
jgi:hypothetical protein